jgi:hypothetical protein
MASKRAANPGNTRPQTKRAATASAGSVRLYTLEVFLLSGPITKEFARTNPVVSRAIVMRGDQTLEQLHHAIFGAFDREEEHMYEFQFGKGPMDPEGARYVLPGAYRVSQAEGRPAPAGWTKPRSLYWA